MDCSLPLYQEKKCCNSFDTFRASDKRQDQYLAAWSLSKSKNSTNQNKTTNRKWRWCGGVKTKFCQMRTKSNPNPNRDSNGNELYHVKPNHITRKRCSANFQFQFRRRKVIARKLLTITIGNFDYALQNSILTTRNVPNWFLYQNFTKLSFCRSPLKMTFR